MIVFMLNQVIAQKSKRIFIFGHSLINHEFQVNLTPSQETSVPHWMHFLAEAAGNDIAVSGQYGFLPQHASLPPIAQWGFDFVDGAWESDYEPFSAANFNSILITPGNFIQWQGPSENYPSKTLSPVSATIEIFNWCLQQEASLNFYIYENWPDMAGFLGNGFPPTESEWESYNNYLNGDFHNWFLEYYKLIKEQYPDACVKMIPIGPIISKLLSKSPFDQIPIENLYEDDAPHGRATTYFLASLITYMAMYEEEAPANFQVEAIIDPVVANNYKAVCDFIWEELNIFKNEQGASEVFCEAPLVTTSETDIIFEDIKVFPNPASINFQISGVEEVHQVELYRIDGTLIFSTRYINVISIDDLERGVYILLGKNKDGSLLYQKKLVKQ